MGKRRPETQDNLVMLLDTMCNLLGGLILISILLAVVSQASLILKPRTAAPPPATPAALAAQLDALGNQVAALRRQLEELGTRTNAAPFPDLTARATAAEAARAALAQAVERARAEREEKEAALEQWRREQERLRRELQRVAERSREVRVPYAHTTTNRAVFAVLRQGALYVATDVSQPFGAGADRGYDLNAVDVQRAEAAGGPKIHTLTPKEGRGQPIRAGAEDGGALRSLLENVNPAAEYVYLAVYPDSYREFNYVKQRIVAKKLEYNWLPLETDETIKILLTTVASGAGEVTQ